MDNKKLLDEMYAKVEEWGGQEGLKHHFDLGPMYAREVRLKAGESGCMHVHDYDHLSLYVGHVKLITDHGVDELTGAGTIFIRKGERHGIQAITDTLWICAHRAAVVDDLNLVDIRRAA